MVNFHLYLSSLLHALTPENLIVMMIALAAGILVGTLPGLTATMAVALLVPLTFAMDSSTGLLLLGAIYTGAIYGGANSAILINTPGTPAAVATTFDGFPMTRKGKAAHAMLGALTGAVIGGLIGSLFLLFVAKPLAHVALSFGPTQIFWLALFGLTTIGSMSRGNVLKGLIAAAIGLTLAMTGEDPVRGFPRFTYGIQELVSGINLIPAMIGFFSLSQLLNLAAGGQSYVAAYQRTPGALRQVLTHVFRKSKLLMLRSSLIGTFIGVLPGAGGEIAAIISYNEARRWSKTPHLYGTGVLDGVLASESAANAMVGGSLVPLLTLGIPGSSVAAVLMGGLLSHGLVPGTQFLAQNGDVAYTFMIGLVIAQLLMFLVGYVMLRLLVKSLSMRIEYIISIVAVLSVIGAYAISGNMIDVVVMLVCGLIGFVLSTLGFDPGPLVLGLILGEIVERGFVQGLLISHQNSILHTFFLQPMNMVLIGLIELALVSPWLLARRQKRLAGHSAQTTGDDRAEGKTLSTGATSSDSQSENGQTVSPGLGGGGVSMRTYNLVLSLVLMGWVTYLLTQTLAMPLLGSYYPRVILTALLVLSGVLFVRSRVKSRVSEVYPFAGVKWRPVFIVITMSVLLIVGMVTLGFYSSAFIVMILQSLLLGRHTKLAIVKAVILSAVTTGLIYSAFWLFLKVSTPLAWGI